MPQWISVTGVAMVVLAVALPGGTQQPTTNPAERRDAAISGVVFDSQTKQPIADAVVGLTVAGLRPDAGRLQFTDTRGRFAFTDLPAGSDYGIVVQKSGYFDWSLGAGFQAAPIRLAPGQWLSNADVALSGPGSISGTVTDESGEPVIGVFVKALARIRVGGADHLAPVQVTTTDDRGMYRVPNLRPGRYSVMVPSVQASVPADASVPTLLGMSAVAIQNARNAGRALPALDPVLDVDSAARLVVRGYPIPPPPEGRLLTYPITFAGGTQMSARTIDAGTDLMGVDVRLSPTPAVRITGLVEGPPDARVGLTLRLLPEGLEELGLGGEAGTALVAADGTFVFANVPSGTYTIEAPVSVNQYLSGDPGLFYAPRVPPPPGLSGIVTISGYPSAVPPGIGFMTARLSGRKYWARTTVSAGTQGAANVVVTLQPTSTMSGRLVADPDPSIPDTGSGLRYVRLETATGDTLQGIARSLSSPGGPAGEFVIEGILPGRYLLRSSSPPWIIKSVIVGGRDYTDRPIDVAAGVDLSSVAATFTNAISVLSGTVRDAAGSAATEAAVIVFPVEPDRWVNYGLDPPRIKTVRASSGAFRIRALPAGDYYVVAVPATGIDDWQEPEFFRGAQAFATRLSIGWGEQKTVDVRLLRIP